LKSIEEYSVKLKEIADHAFGYGVDAIGIEQFKNGRPDSWDEKILTKFKKKCHEGFKIAQKLLIDEVKYYQLFLREHTEQLKEFRRQRNEIKENETKNKINIIKQRISTLFHIADGIAWQLIGGQIHIARRFYINQNSLKFLDSSNIEHTIKVSDSINKKPENFALITDLTNFVQLGDLLVRQGNKLRIMELKEGKVNKIIEGFLKTNKNNGLVFNEQKLEDKFDSNTVKQIKRIQRQQERAKKAINIINKDEGVDPVTEENITILTPSVPTEYYYDELREMYEELKTKIWSYKVVDHCVNIGMYKGKGLGMADFAIKQHLETYTKNYIIIDWLSITNNLSEPIFAKPFPPDFIIDILTGKVKVIIGLDMDVFIELFNSFGLNTRWLSEKETTKKKQNTSMKGMVIINKKGIVVNLPSNQEMIIYGGTISKIIYDSISPTSVALSMLSINNGK